MSAVGYASIPVTLSFANAARDIQSKLKPQLDKLSKDAATAIDKNVGDAAERASRKVERARQREVKATEAAVAAESKFQAEVQKREGALKRVEAATLNLEMAQRKSAEAVAKAQSEYDKLVSSGTASADRLAAAERKIADARDRGKADVLKREEQLDRARSGLTTQTQRVADAEVKLKGAKNKAAEASERVISATKQLDQAQSQAQGSSKGLAGALDSMGDAANSAADKSGGFFGKLGRGVGKVGGLAAAFAGLSGVMGTMHAGFAKVTSIEDTTASLGILMGSAEEATKVMGQLQESNQGTPYSFDAWADAGKNLIAFGVDAEKVSDIVTGLGEAASASGKGEDALNSMANAFGKAAASGKISMETINSLAEGGVQGLAIMANHYGVTTEEMQKKISSGAIEASEGIDILTKGILEGSSGMAGEIASMSGVMGKMAETTSGRITNMKAAFNNAAKAMFEEINPLIGDLALKITDMTYAAIDVFKGKVVPAIREVVDAFKAVGEWASRNSDWLEAIAVSAGVLVGAYKLLVVQQKIAAAGGFVKWTMKAVKATKLWSAATKAQTAAQTALNLVMSASKIGLVIAAIAALVAGLTYFFTKTETGQKVWAGLMDGFKAGWEWLSGTFASGWEWLSNTFASGWDFLSEKISGFWQGIKSGWDTVSDVFSTLKAAWSEITGIFTGTDNGMGALFDLFGEEKALAIVGTLEMVKERFDAIVSTIKDNLQGVADTFTAVTDTVTAVVQGAGEIIKDVIATGWLVISSIFTGEWGQIGEIIATGLEAIKTHFSEAVENVKAIWGDWLAGLRDRFTEFREGFGDTVRAMWDYAKDQFSTAIANIRQNVADWCARMGERVSQMVEDMMTTLREMPGRALEWFQEMNDRAIAKMAEWVENAKAKAQEVVDGVVTWVQEMPDRVKGIFSDAGSWLVQAGKDIFNGLWNGMKSIWADIRGWFSEKTNEIRNFFSNANASASAQIGMSHADGAIVAFADGGARLPQQATIQRPVGSRGLVQWAEPETGGEAFIPLAASKRARSTKILATVADSFGMSLVGRDGQAYAPGVVSELGPTRVRAFADGGIMTAKQVLDFVSGKSVGGKQAPRSLEGAPYTWGGGLLGNWGDCSGAMSGIAAFIVGMQLAGRKFATGNEGAVLSQMGFTRGTSSGKNAFEVGFFNGGPYGGHTSGTIYDAMGKATNVEMGGGRGNGQIGGAAAGARHSQYTDKYWIGLKGGAGFDSIESTSVDGMTVSGGASKSKRSIDWGTASSLASEWESRNAREKGIQEYLRSRARVYDTGGVLPTGGVAVNLGKPEVVFPASATKSLAELAKTMPMFAEAIDRFISNDFVAAGLEIATAVRGGDDGYAALANLIGDQLAKKVTTKLAFIGDQVRDMADGSNMRAFLADMSASQALGLADEVGKLVGLTSLGSTFGGVVEGFENLEDAAVQQVDAAKAVQQAEKNLAEARAEYAEMLAETPEASKKTLRRIEDAEAGLAKARKSGKPEQIAKAEKKLARVREDAADEMKKTGEKSAEDLIAAQEAVAEAEQDHTQALGVVEMAAKSTGQAQIMMAVKVAETVINIGKQIWDLAVRITDWINNIRIKTRTAVWELAQSWTQLTETVDQHRSMVVGLRLELARAAVEVVDATISLRTAQADVVRAQLEGVQKVASAQQRLDEERAKLTKKQVHGFRDMSLEYDRFYHASLRQQQNLVDGQELVGRRQTEISSSVIEWLDREGIAVELGLDAKLAAQAALDAKYQASLDGRELSEAQLFQAYRDALADQLVGEEAFHALKEASLDEQLAWQARVDRAAELGLKEELAARARVTPEILALSREVAAEDLARQKAVAEAQLKSVEAAFAQQRALVQVGRLQAKLASQMEEFERLTSDSMGMSQGQAIVGEEISRLLKENAEIMGKRDSAGAGARNFFGKMFAWTGDPLGWTKERESYDAQIAANEAQIAELKKSKHASGVFSEKDLEAIDKATKLAATFFAQGNDDAAKAALAASPLGRAQQSLAVHQTRKRIADWEQTQEDLADSVEDAVAELRKQVETLPLRFKSEELGSRESAERLGADALRADDARVRAAFAEMARFEGENAARVASVREPERVVNFTFGRSRDALTTVGELEDSVIEVAERLGAVVGDVRELRDERRTSAADRVRAAIGKF